MLEVDPLLSCLAGETSVPIHAVACHRLCAAATDPARASCSLLVNSLLCVAAGPARSPDRALDVWAQSCGVLEQMRQHWSSRSSS
eukprot:6180407-Pleurochrysis_carterae.AAC.4